MQRDESADIEQAERTFVETVDFYHENGLMVMTRQYLLDRGYCCRNACRHCPYDTDSKVLE